MSKLQCRKREGGQLTQVIVQIVSLSFDSCGRGASFTVNNLQELQRLIATYWILLLLLVDCRQINDDNAFNAIPLDFYLLFPSCAINIYKFSIRTAAKRIFKLAQVVVDDQTISHTYLKPQTRFRSLTLSFSNLSLRSIDNAIKRSRLQIYVRAPRGMLKFEA